MGTFDRLAKKFNLCLAFKGIGNHQPNDHVVHIRDTLSWTFSLLTCLANVDTRVLDDTVRQVYDTCFQTEANTEKCLAQAPACHVVKSLRVMS